MLETISVKTNDRNELIDITSEVRKFIKANDLKSGIVTIYVSHTTAGVTINENADPDVARDIIDKLRRLIPQRDGYHHAEGNSDAHIKSSFMGSSVQVIVENGELLLGTWQGIYFCEFDGPRNRRIIIKAISG
jgi:secondary thiamine-phosphate synthase enzyme